MRNVTKCHSSSAFTRPITGSEPTIDDEGTGMPSFRNGKISCCLAVTARDSAKLHVSTAKINVKCGNMQNCCCTCDTKQKRSRQCLTKADAGL